MDDKNFFASQRANSDKTLPAEATHEDTDKSEVIPSSGEDSEGVTVPDETVYPKGMKLLLLA